MSQLRCGVIKLACACVALCLPLIAQQQVPDAPQPKIPPSGQFPEGAPPAPKNTHPEEPAATPTPMPLPAATPAQRGGIATSRNDLPKFTVFTNFVQVPVTVKDSKGKPVPALRPEDFTIYEDGVPQKLVYMTSDPFPLSAAVVVDTDLPSQTMNKINDTLPALIGAFSEFDEVALYRYGHTVSQIAGFAGANNVSQASLNRMKRPGRNDGSPLIYGPMGGGGGPTINGHEGVPGQTTGAGAAAPAPVQEAYVLNDAILRAAQDLSKRPRDRRRIIFLISDGREAGSNAHYDEVKKFLLSQNIQVYALGVDTAAIPIYDQLNRIRLPGFGTGNILGKYASDTAGETFAKFDRASIEQAYSQITSMARNQYTLGYTTRATPASTYRTIDVHVHRPGLEVIAKKGYYSVPPPPRTQQ